MEVAKSAAADALDAANAKLSDATERAHWLESKLVEDAATDESKKREDDAAEGALKREIERLTEENKRMEGECATLRENIRAESKMMSDNAIKLGKELLDAKKRLGAVAGELDNVKKVKEEIAAMFEEKSNEASATVERLRASEEKCEYFSKELASAISQSQEIREELMRSKAAAAEAAAESEEKTRAGVGAGEKTDDDATSTAAAAEIERLRAEVASTKASFEAKLMDALRDANTSASVLAVTERNLAEARSELDETSESASRRTTRDTRCASRRWRRSSWTRRSARTTRRRESKSNSARWVRSPYTGSHTTALAW
jgi:chromosome segregation ATPase